MKVNRSNRMLAGALVAAGAMASTAVFAESGFDTTGPPYSVAARHNFVVIIPAFLSFRVGTAGATIDTMTFSPTALALGNSTPVAGTGGTGGGGGSTTDVVLLSNAGQVTITATNNSALGLSTGVVADGFINYTEITTATSNAALGAPTLTNAGGTTTTPTLNAGTRVTNQTAVWTYGYANTTVPSAGTYGGATSGQVTYTAATP